MLALIADDDRTQRTLVRRMLDQLSVESLEAENGQELLALLERRRADLVVIDYDMPVLDGAAALRAIRASERHAEVAVVCVSSLADQAIVEQLIGLGLTDYLLKPVDVRVALPRLQAVVQSLRRPRPRRPTPR